MRELSNAALIGEARRVLGRSPLFRGLSPSLSADLIGRARIRSFEKDEAIFTMGSEGNCLMAVLNGRVRIAITSSDGGEMLLALLDIGEIFGEIAVLDGRPRTADAIAHTPCTLAVLDRRDLLTMLEREPGAWLAIVELLCARLRSTDQHIVEIALLNLPARLASALLRMSNASSSTDTKRVTLSQRELGEMIGASRESVNKCLSQWRHAGLVDVQGAAIRLLDSDALRRIAESD